MMVFTECCRNSTFISSPQSFSASSVEELEVLDISSTTDETDENFNLSANFCGCEKNIINELCIWEAIDIWNSTESPLICAGCYFNVANQLGHVCLSWELQPSERDEFLNDRTWNVILNPSNFIQIYNAYVSNHDNSDESNIVIFEYSVRKLLERKVEAIRNKLIAKDITTGPQDE